MLKKQKIIYLYPGAIILLRMVSGLINKITNKFMSRKINLIFAL